MIDQSNSPMSSSSQKAGTSVLRVVYPHALLGYRRVPEPNVETLCGGAIITYRFQISVE